MLDNHSFVIILTEFINMLDPRFPRI